MVLDNYGDTSEGDGPGEVFVLQNIPANYNEDLIINYVESTLDIDVKEVKMYPFIPGKALVYLDKKLEDFKDAERKIAKACVESRKIKLLKTTKEAAVVVNDLDVKKLSEEFLCLYFESEYADGCDIIESSKAWPELNMAIVRFHPLHKTVVETVLEKCDHVPLPSEDYHIYVQPFYHNFHEYIGQQMIHKEGVETATVFDNDSEEKEEEEEEDDEDEEEEDNEDEEEEDNEDEEEEDNEDEEEEEEEDEKENLKGLGDFKEKEEKKGRNNKNSYDECETDSGGESSSEEEDVKVKPNTNQAFEKDITLSSQKTSTTIRGGFSRRGARGTVGGLAASSRKGSHEKDMSNKDSDLKSSWRSGNLRGRVHSGFKHTNNSHKSYDSSSNDDKKSEVKHSQRSAKPRGGSSVYMSRGAKNFQSSNYSGFLNDTGDLSGNEDLLNHYSRSSLGQHHFKSDMSKQYNTSLASLKSTDQDSSLYFGRQSKLPDKEINAQVSQSLPQQDPAFKKAKKESQDQYQRDIAAKDAKIKQLEEELFKKVEQSKTRTEKIPMTAWQKEFLPHCFGSFDDCRIHFDQQGDVAVLEGNNECVKKHQLILLKELKKLKEEIWALTPAMHYVLSKELGKRYLHNLNLNSSSQLNGAKAFLQDQSLLVVAKDDQSLQFALDFLKARMNYKEEAKSAATVPIEKLNLLQSTLEHKYLVKVSWSDSETCICVEGIKDDVFASSREVTTLIEEYGVHEKSFRVNGAHAKLLYKNFLDKINQHLEGVKVVDLTTTEVLVDIKFKGDKRAVNVVDRKLAELKTKVTDKSWDLRSEFKKPEELMLITKGFTSEKMKKKVDSFEMKHKCVVIPKLPTLETFKVKASKKSRLAPSAREHPEVFTSKHRGHFKTTIPKQLEAKLILKVTDTCQLVVKPYGDIIKESSDILVCVLAQNVDLRKTRVGQTFNRICPTLWKILQAEREAHPTDAVLTTKGQFNPLKCLAICHVILTPWNPNSSPTQLSTAIQSVLSQAIALGAKSVSFPVLGCGRAFGFPPSDVAQITLASIKASNIGNTIQKVVLLAPDSELFKEFKTAAPKHFQPVSVHVQGAVGGTLSSVTIDDNEVKVNDDDEDKVSESDEVEDSEDDKPSIEIMPLGATQISNSAEISIVAMYDSGLENMWSNLKKDIVKVCLHTDYFNQEIADYWPRDSRENILQEAKKLCVWVERSPNPKTKKPGYIIKGEKQQVEKMINVIKKEFTEFSSNLPKQRIKSDKAPKRGTCDFLKHAAKSDEHWPSYWTLNKPKTAKSWLSKLGSLMSSNSEEQKILVSVDAKTKDAIINLIAKTWDQSLVGQGNDARGLSHTGIKVTKVKRIENIQLFESYSMLRKQLFSKMSETKHICPDIGKLRGSKGRVVTTECLEDFMKEELYYEVNEHYLFHGTKCPDAIVTNGIDPRVSSEGGMFGRGIYTAEKFTKSDQYTDSQSQRTAPGTTLYMILARVLLGNVFLCDHHHKSVANKQSVKLTRPPCLHCKEDVCNCKNQALYDSVMGDGKWIFREFVVYDKHQCYPEYLISYQRV